MAQGKQNEGAACPENKLEFKFFSSPEEAVDKGVRVNVTVYQGSTYMINIRATIHTMPLLILFTQVKCTCLRT